MICSSSEYRNGVSGRIIVIGDVREGSRQFGLLMN
jgi:hypothetical protein